MKVLITGMGAVTPIGVSVASFWPALCRGEPAVGPLTRFESRDGTVPLGGEIRVFRLPDPVAAAGSGADRAVQFMIAAAWEAMRDARLPLAGSHPEIGVVLGTNFGSVGSADAWLVPPSARSGEMPSFDGLNFHDATDRVGDLGGLTGPRATLSLSCASGAAALACGADLIRAGRANAVLTGGYDALSRFAWIGLSVLRTMSRSAVRPFDKNRDGTLFSEGAGALLLESEESARARGAPVYAELAGYALNNNAFHMTAPAREGAGTAAVLRRALEDAGVAPEEVDHINAHGTGTQPNDVTETQAIKAVFGAHAARIPITSNKGVLGHLMGAAGSVEAIATILSLREGLIPPTRLELEPDPACDLDYVVREPRRAPLRVALSNSAGIGGCNAALILRKP